MGSRNQAAQDEPVPAIDFERASLSWLTTGGSFGRWRIAAAATFSSAAASGPERHVLAPTIMAGDVYGIGRLPLAPDYTFTIVAGPDGHTIWRDYAATTRDTSSLNAEVFESLSIDTPSIERRRVPTDGLGGHGALWPLFCAVRVPLGASGHWDLEFPIAHVNHRLASNGDSADRSSYQVETGPILVPAALVAASDAAIAGGFALAYAFFNRTDQIDLALLHQGTGSRRYSAFARLNGVTVSLVG